MAPRQLVSAWLSHSDGRGVVTVDGAKLMESTEEMFLYDVTLTALAFLGMFQFVPSNVMPLATVSLEDILRCAAAALTFAPALGLPPVLGEF